MDEVKIIKSDEVDKNILPEGTQVKRFITQERDATCFILGLATIEPGADHGINITRQGKDEAYYMLKGKLVLICGDKRLEAKEGDVVLFRAGQGYKVTNDGETPAMLLYVICPAAE